ncbi:MULTISPECIES: hypothetical protein [unclassified Streptomyces]|uniref:hypothetical protein n=1 Tax=unclassified Streptomyces TaxID=2593676 RepID=UPI003320DF64
MNQVGVAIQIYSNDHAPPHAHVKGKGKGKAAEVRIGMNGKPILEDKPPTKLNRLSSTAISVPSGGTSEPPWKGSRPMANAEVTPELRHALRQLEERVGTTVSDVTDGHARWELYRAALASDTARPGLLAAVTAEADGALASAVVGEALERVPRADRETWVQALAPSVRAFSERRARELGILEELRSRAEAPTLGTELVDGWSEWSDWLQLRIGAEVSEPSVLRVLAESGRTKRIRRTATEALAGSRRSTKETMASPPSREGRPS